MTTTTEVAAANGIILPTVAWEAAQQAGVPYWAACAFLEQESAGGKNIYGHDGGWYSGAGDVTTANYADYLAGRSQHNAQGVGPMQLTWPPYQDQADQAGGCWDPTTNIATGLTILAGFIHGGDTWHEAAARWNGSENYADQMDARFTRWQALLDGATPPGEKMQQTGLYAPVQYLGQNYSDGTPKLITLRLQQALARLRTALGYTDQLDMAQGCYHDGSQSAGTHSGADVVDLSEYDYERKAIEGAKIGLMVFHRPFNWDGAGGSAHCHCLLRGSRQFSPEAAAQITDWDKGLNGLANHAKYTAGPQPKVGNFVWQKPLHEPPAVKFPAVQTVAEDLWQVRQDVGALTMDWAVIKEIRASVLSAWQKAHEVNWPPT